MKRLCWSLLFIGLSNLFFGQGKIKGKITDENGEPIFGVVIVVMENQSNLAKSDFDGLFELSLSNSNLYTLNFVMVGYQSLTDKVSLKDNEVFVKEYTLPSASYAGATLTIEEKVIKSNDSFMEKVKMNSATTIDYISSETMKKTGDQNVVNAIARVSGVSTSGGLITVRGIGDRYVKTTLNGSRIPTLDPLTNNIKLDIFPSSLIDNIIITKTANSQLASDWSGAYISVETKDYPDKLMVSVESQLGYNAQTTFKNFLTSERSNTDFLGFDGGLRIREDENVVTPNVSPTTYQELVALGLGDYYQGLGVNGWVDGTAQGDAYFRLGLVELGLLAPGSINDDAAFIAARNQYNQQFKPTAFDLINPEGTDYGSGFANNWNVKRRIAPLNFTQSVTIGNEVELFGKPLGFFLGFRYGSSYRYDPNGVSQRVGDESLNFPLDRQDRAEMGREVNSWNALLNMSYKFHENHKASLMLMPNFMGVNDVAQYYGIPFSSAFEEVEVFNNIFYEQRRQMVSQFNSQHYFPTSALKLDVNVSYTTGNSVAPDFKVTQFNAGLINYNQVTGYGFSPTFGEGIRRFYRYLNEDLLDIRLDATKPIKKWAKEGFKRSWMFGLGSLKNYRKIDNDEYKLFANPSTVIDPLESEDLDAYLSPDKFVMGDNFQFYYIRNNYLRNHSFGNSDVHAAYWATDIEFTHQMRLIGGLRAEYTNIFVDVDDYFKNGYAKDDVRRENVGGFPLVNPSQINQLDLLPNVNLVYKLKNESKAQTNVRLNYSKSLARPSIRELSDAAILDNEFRTLIYGNSALKIVKVDNFDLRAESYLKGGDMISASAFYKIFKNHIEMGFGSAGITWENIERSNVMGLEFEGKKQLGKYFETRTNVTIVKSQAQFIRKDLVINNDGSKTYIPLDTLYRPMFGQAPYLINSILTYQNDTLGITATVSYNVQGPRLVIAGAIKGRPDVYEMPRNQIDFKVTKNLGEHWVVGLNIRDILNTAVRRSYKIDRINANGTIESTDGWFDYDRFRFGTTYLLTVNYRI
jgi:outer membrane receptor for ferrienterochelin and colicin